MAEISWKKPVVVFAGKAANVRWTISDAPTAAVVLLSHWPTRAAKDKAHMKAQKVILSCLKGKCDAEEARSAFVTAAEKADILAS
ncbi:DUF982 domain-containing protein [Nitratireductor sp. GCM10026969]|uniref:DUF982 domain-containing protein n=1 Tax=Nitratireductor sp. GCM10026969 TaxID=3252645 RepID=UPI003612B5C1